MDEDTPIEKHLIYPPVIIQDNTVDNKSRNPAVSIDQNKDSPNY